MRRNAVDEVRRISHSEMKTFLRCRRKWWLGDLRRLGPVTYEPTGPLRQGSRMHVGLEAFYTPGSDPFAALKGAQEADWSKYVAQTKVLGLEPDAALHAAFTKECELERIMLDGYGDWVAETGVDAGLTVIATEQIITVHGEEFAPDLVERFGPFDVVGKLDMRVRRDRDGARMFLDHKTARSLTDILPTLPQDPQMLHYHWLEFMASQDEGGWCDGALYNVIKKVKRTKTAKPPFYDRYEVYHGADEIMSYQYRMTEIIRDMLTTEERLRPMFAGDLPSKQDSRIAYPNVTRDCSWDCPFKTVCPMFDDGSRAEAMLAEQFAERNPLARYDETPGQLV